MESKEKEQSLKLAEHYFRNNNYAFAQQILDKVIKEDFNNSKANELLAYIYGNSGQVDISFDLLTLACNQNDCSPEALYYLGSMQLKKCLFAEAIKNLKKSILKGGDFFEGLHDLATAQANIGDLASSLDNYQKCLKFGETSSELFFNIARTFDELKRFDEAIAHYDKALSLKPDYHEAWSNKGVVLYELKRYEEAIVHYDKVLALKPDYHEAWSNKGVTLYELKRYEEAIVHYDMALSLKPDYHEAWSNKGVTLYELKRYEEAIVHYDKALNLMPDYAEGWSNKGVISNELKRYDEAIAYYDKALSLKPNYHNAWNNKGVVLYELKRYEEAIVHYDMALSLKPDYHGAWGNKAVTLDEIKRYEEAITYYDKALSLNPSINWRYGDLVYTKMKICNWLDLGNFLKNIANRVMINEKVAIPFKLLPLIDDALLHKKSSEAFLQNKYPFNPTLASIPKHLKKQKIQIGYFSANFNNHAIGYLVAELFELHDKSQFELIGFSFGPKTKDVMRQRLEKSFDQFIECSDKSDIEIVQLSRDLSIDIAVDLMGFTKDFRTGIFANRGAPIQVNYLGYPGTMGADYMDYIIADRTLIPIESQAFYSEKVVYLPNTYQVNDRKRLISDKQFTRNELVLPAERFVFCCFNNNYKILPATFAGWIRILKAVDGSVLWLLQDNDLAVDNLKKEALKHGVDSCRLIFAERMPLSEHLARHRQADLFLDTFPYNAHTTASDALWAGLPVLTMMGQSFASRVAASLLNAIDLPELITSTQDEYEALAIELALNPQKLANIKYKLETNRLTTPLFDTPLFTRNIEAAYIKMMERYHADLKPDHLSII
jgi:tetratricopeptide (TPR) repeat protein